MTKNIWDYTRAIQEKSQIDFNEKECSGYMLTLHFSMDKNLAEVSNEMNKILYSLPKGKAVYDYFYNKVPKGNRFIKWPKKIKEKTDKKLDELMKTYNISRQEALLYKDLV